jgi:flagellar motor protein MotB
MLMAATFVAARGARTAAEPASQAAVASPAPSATPANVVGGKSGDAKGAKQRPDTAKARERSAKEEAAAKSAEQARAERKLAKVIGLPDPVAKALANKRVVVLFFFQNAADDDATGTGVNSLRGIRGVKIFRDGITNLAKYRAVTAGLGVTQAPAVVVVGRNRKAQLLEGYVDQATLTQIVVDAR